MTKFKRIALATLTLIALTVSIAAQQTQDDPQKARPRTTTASSSQDKDKKPVVGDRLEPDDARRTPTDVPDDVQANRTEQVSEESAFTPYYNNFFNTYKLGPEDIISVEVFNQERYSRKGIQVYEEALREYLRSKSPGGEPARDIPRAAG